MSVVDQVKTLLSVEGTPFKVIEGAAGMAAARETGPLNTPAAFVFLGREASGENQRATGPAMQRQERDLSVVIVVDNAADRFGSAGADELETIKTWLRTQLIGHVPTGEASQEPVTHVEGAVADFENGRVWFEDVYSTPTYLKEVSS